MKIKIALFAAAREIAGSNLIELELDPAATLGDLKIKLATKHPQLAPLITKSLFSVNHEYANEEQLLYDGIEVGLIPPVSGG